MSEERDEAEILRDMNYDDVQAIYAYIAEYAKTIENPELLADAAESLRLAIETRDSKLITKARKQIILFINIDQGSSIQDPVFNGYRSDEAINQLF